MTPVSLVGIIRELLPVLGDAGKVIGAPVVPAVVMAVTVVALDTDSAEANVSNNWPVNVPLVLTDTLPTATVVVIIATLTQ